MKKLSWIAKKFNLNLQFLHFQTYEIQFFFSFKPLLLFYCHRNAQATWTKLKSGAPIVQIHHANYKMEKAEVLSDRAVGIGFD